MNIENLKVVVEVLGTIREDQLDMHEFIISINEGCGSVACVVGHCMLSDRFDFDFDEEKSPTIQAIAFVENVLDIRVSTIKWEYMFGGCWASVDNSINGAIKRIEKVINGFEPEVLDIPCYW